MHMCPASLSEFVVISSQPCDAFSVTAVASNQRVSTGYQDMVPLRQAVDAHLVSMKNISRERWVLHKSHGSGTALDLCPVACCRRQSSNHPSFGPSCPAEERGGFRDPAEATDLFKLHSAGSPARSRLSGLRRILVEFRAHV